MEKDIWQIIITAEYRNYLLEGFFHTLVLTFVAALIGLFIGLVVAIINSSLVSLVLKVT